MNMIDINVIPLAILGFELGVLFGLYLDLCELEKRK